MSTKGRGASKRGARPGTEQSSWSGLRSSGNTQTLLVLAAIMLLAFFLRSFFAYGTSIGNDFALSGGADAVYYERVIEYILATGQQLTQEPLHNYPYYANNLREPLYAWTVVMGGLFLSLFGIPAETAVGMSFMFSTPVFGALAIIPVFLMAREAFGTRVGLIAAALMAVSAGALSLTVLSDADHDALAMFFILWGFYFLMKALMGIRGMRWVDSWISRSSIVTGVKGFAVSNRVSLLYALMAGMSLALAAMTWKGFIYALVIITLFLFVQLLVDRFSNRDSMGLILIYTITGLGTLVFSMPYYFGYGSVSNWWDLPALMVLGGFLVGSFFTVTRDKPWTLTLPGFVIIMIAGLAVMYVFFPSQFAQLIGGAGYFGTSKLYGTIAEAQSPSFSSLALSFGVTTLWLAIVGVFYALVKIPKVKAPFYSFIVVWMVVAMLMASNAQRFVFNSSMAFAIAAAITINLILVRVDLRQYYKDIRSAEWRSKWRRALKPVPLVTVLFMTFLVAAPNVWFAVDAGIPNNTKADYDEQIHDGLPSFLSADDYSHGDLQYLGSTGYRITTQDNWYYMDAWDWLSEQNSHIHPERDRPAYLSWWDYGFEAGHYGKHPTVAENFQRGYQMAAQFITAQSEEEAIALLTVRILETESFSDDVRSTLQAHGVSPDALEDRIFNSGDYVSKILANPDVYGNYAEDLSSSNARYIESQHFLTSRLNVNELASLYHDIRSDTGFDIGYFAIDTRLFPWSFQDTGIFNAPAKLADHVMDQYGMPADFYEIYAVLDSGQTVPLDRVTDEMQVEDYVLFYKDKLYDSMMWRAFMGFNPADVGETQQGTPGMSGSLADKESMQGWGLNHFRMVYRTAMHNPHDDYQAHPDAWKFISYDQGKELQQKIAAGDATGVVDLSTSSLRNGVVFLQYYDGVEISGEVSTEGGDPLSDVRVTVYDEYGIPHMEVKTDEDGRYEVLAPFGDVEVKFSTGSYDSLMMRGENVLATDEYEFTYSQAMREDAAVNPASAGHSVSGDVVLPASEISGELLLDDEGMEGAKASFVTDTRTVSATADANGEYELSGLMPAEGRFVVEHEGTEVENKTVDLGIGETKAIDLSIESARIEASLVDERNVPMRNVEVELHDAKGDKVAAAHSDTTGTATFDKLLPGRYSLKLADESYSFGEKDLSLSEGEQRDITLEVREAMTLSGKVRLGNGTAVPDATVVFSSLHSDVTTVSGSDGRYSVTMPKGEYTMYAHGMHDGKEMAALEHVPGPKASSYNIEMSDAAVLSGTVRDNGAVAGAELQLRADNAVLNAVSSSTGAYRFAVPAGLYSLHASSDGKAWWDDVSIEGMKSKDVALKEGASLSGTVWYDADGDGTLGEQEGLSNVDIDVKDSDDRTLSLTTDEDGSYSLTVPEGTYFIDLKKEFFMNEGLHDVKLEGSETHDVEMTPEAVDVSGSICADDVTIEFLAVEGSGGASKNVTSSAGGYNVSLLPGEYEVSVLENINDDARYEHESELNVGLGSESIEHHVELRKMIKTKVTPDSSSDTVSVSGLDQDLQGLSEYADKYLQEGEHSVHSVSSDGSEAFLGMHNASEDNTTINLEGKMTGASKLSGEVLFDDERMSDAHGELEISNDTAHLDVEVTEGEYDTVLPEGVYDLDLKFTAIDEDRYYLYTHESEANLSSEKVLDLNVERELRKVDIDFSVLKDGSPTSADIGFHANSPSAVSESVTGESGTVALAPGDYTVYANADGDVHLGTLTVEPFEEDSIEIKLEAGESLMGQFKASGSSVSVDATISDGDARMPLDNDADGSFNLPLPQGYYDISAETSVTERGVSVAYDLERSVALNQAENLEMEMDRDDQRSITLTHGEQLRTVDAGKSFTFALEVKNTGNTMETVTLESNGWDMAFDANDFDLQFGKSDTKSVVVTVTAPKDAAVDHDPVKVEARGDDGRLLGSTTLSTEVNPWSAVDLSFKEAKKASGDSYDYAVTLKNDGNVRETFDLSVNSASLEDAGWQVSIMDSGGSVISSKELAAFQEEELTIRLTPMPGETQSVPQLTMTASSAETSDSVSFTGNLPNVHLPADKVDVGGDAVFPDAGEISMTTWALLGLSIAAITMFILMGMTRGVFSRKKR